MTVQRDPDRLIRAFLDEGLTELPDRTFDAVRAHIERTRQRAVIGPWRNPPMRTFRYMAIAAVIALIVIIGATLVGGGRVTSSPSPGPTAVGSPPMRPTFVPSAAQPYHWPNALHVGDYATSFAWNLPFAVGFTVPAGWESRDVEIIKGDMSVAVELAWDLYDNPCAATPAVVDSGSTPMDFANALATNANLDVSAPAATTIGGRSAVTVTYRARPGVACVGEDSKLWSSPAWMILPVSPLGPPSWPLRVGLHRLSIIDMDGTRLLFDATAGANPTPAKEAELQGVLDSLGFTAPTAAYDLGACTVTLTSRPAGALVTPESLVTMSRTHSRILAGALPETFVEPAISAHVDFRVADLTGSGPESMRPTTQVVAPPGSGGGGVATLVAESLLDVPGSRDLVGTFLLDAPGTWWLRITVPYAGCAYQQPLVVVAPG